VRTEDKGCCTAELSEYSRVLCEVNALYTVSKFSGLYWYTKGDYIKPADPFMWCGTFGNIRSESGQLEIITPNEKPVSARIIVFVIIRVFFLCILTYLLHGAESFLRS